MRALPILLLLFAPFSGWGAITDQPRQYGSVNVYEKIQLACKALLQAGPKGNITTLTSLYGVTTNVEIREAITAASGLYWMVNQHLPNFERSAEHLRTNFLDSKYAPLLDREANLIICTNCHAGVTMVPCPDCNGTGKCRACGGRGKVAGIVSGETSIGAGNNNLSFARPGSGSGGSPVRTMGGATTLRPGSDPGTQQTCAICGGSGACKVCKGTKLVKGRCPYCLGFGSIFNKTRATLAYLDVLKHLQELAFAAGMTECGMVLLEDQWLDARAAVQLKERRSEELAEFVRVATEAERAATYTNALLLLDRAIARHPASIYTDEVLRVQAMLRADATNKLIHVKAEYGPDHMAMATNNPRREIGIIIEAVLTACSRGTNEPLFIASQAHPALPSNPAKWKMIGEPEVLDRAARVRVNIDRPTRSGFLATESWDFRMNYEGVMWKVWQTTGPKAKDQ